MVVTLLIQAKQIASEVAGQARTVDKLMRQMMKAALEWMLNTNTIVQNSSALAASDTNLLLAFCTLFHWPSVPVTAFVLT